MLPIQTKGASLFLYLGTIHLFYNVVDVQVPVKLLCFEDLHDSYIAKIPNQEEALWQYLNVKCVVEIWKSVPA